ncbi:SpoOM protein [Lentzea atacamensis]|uniref:SpoOM protein n=1 Tax=Lentzea atacamensis TaxID=531938 RepID=A0ABX9DWB6_9PSEU|nr:SpoOM protein [Lentzea atacamensis]
MSLIGAGVGVLLGVEHVWFEVDDTCDRDGGPHSLFGGVDRRRDVGSGGRFGQLGFSFRGADVEAGRIHGVHQELGFYQEIEFFPPAQYAGRISQVELTFVASPHELYVVLEADKRGGMFSSGGDAFGHFRVSHQEAQATDWASAINGWLAQIAERGHANPAFGGQPAYGQPMHGHHGYDQHRHHGHRSGPGIGGMVAAGAAGVVGGMIIGEVVEDVFEDDGGDFAFEE